MTIYKVVQPQEHRADPWRIEDRASGLSSIATRRFGEAYDRVETPKTAVLAARHRARAGLVAACQGRLARIGQRFPTRCGSGTIPSHGCP
jgi:hypothetical protein